MKKRNEPDLEQELEKSYANWEQLKEFGGSDPFHTDGCNMNLVRNHILSWKRQMEEAFGDNREKYPPVYYKELPPETEHNYMAHSGEIRDRAREVLELYVADVNFQYLYINQDQLTVKEADSISAKNVLGYVSALAAALKQDDLVTLRRHAKGAERYLDAFAGCAEKMKEIMSKEDREANIQLNLFQVGLDKDHCR